MLSNPTFPMKLRAGWSHAALACSPWIPRKWIVRKTAVARNENSPVHKIVLGAGVIQLEYLNNLRQVTAREFELIALPLNIRGGDGAPARCIARFDS